MPNISNLVRSLSTDGRFTAADAQKVIEKAKTPAEVAEVKKLMTDPGLAPLLSGDAKARLANFVGANGVGGAGLGALPYGAQIFLKDGGTTFGSLTAKGGGCGSKHGLCGGY